MYTTKAELEIPMLALELFPIYKHGKKEILKYSYDLFLDVGTNKIVEITIKYQERLNQLIEFGNSFLIVNSLWFTVFQYYLDYYYFHNFKKVNNVVGYTSDHQLINAWFEVIEILLSGECIFESFISIMESTYTQLSDDPIKQQLSLLLLIGLIHMRNGNFEDESAGNIIQKLVQKMSYYDEAEKKKRYFIDNLPIIREQFELCREMQEL